MSLRVLIGPIGLALAAATLAPPLGAGADTAERAAPDRGAKSTWTEADKAGFGTAHGRASKVWFTLEGGRVSEVFYPDLSTPSVRSLELTVTDGGHDRPPDRDMTRLSRPDERSLRFTQVSTGRRPLPAHRGGRHRPRPRRVVLRVRLESLDGSRTSWASATSPRSATARGRPGRRPDVAGDGEASASPAVDARTLWQSQHAAERRGGPTSRRSDRRRASAGGQVATPTGPGRDRLAASSRHAGLGFGRSAQAPGRGRTQPGPDGGAYDAGWHDYLARSSRSRPAPRRSSGSTSPPPSCSPPARTRPTRAPSWPARPRRGSGATRSRT